MQNRFAEKENQFSSLFVLVLCLFGSFICLLVLVLQIRSEREMKQQMMLQEEETLEMMETFSSMQQEVELKTKKLRRVR